MGRGWVCACAVRLFSTRPQLQWSHDSRLSVAKMDIDPRKKSLHYSLGRVYLNMFVMHHVKAGFHPCTSFSETKLLLAAHTDQKRTARIGITIDKLFKVLQRAVYWGRRARGEQWRSQVYSTCALIINIDITIQTDTYIWGHVLMIVCVSMPGSAPGHHHTCLSPLFLPQTCRPSSRCWCLPHPTCSPYQPCSPYPYHHCCGFGKYISTL